MKPKCNESAYNVKRNTQNTSYNLKLRFIVIPMLLLIIMIFPRTVFAYIDPGTTSVIFSSLAYLLGMLSVFVGILIWPIRRFYYYIREKLGERRKRLALFIAIGTLVVLTLVFGVVAIYYFF